MQIVFKYFSKTEKCTKNHRKNLYFVPCGTEAKLLTLRRKSFIITMNKNTVF